MKRVHFSKSPVCGSTKRINKADQQYDADRNQLTSRRALPIPECLQSSDGERDCYGFRMPESEQTLGPRPDARTTMTRAIVLSHVFLKARATPPPELLARFTKDEDRKLLAGKMQEMFARQIERIRATGLWELLEDSEREFMLAGIFETTMRQRIDASWLAESIMCLHWALGRKESIPPYDQEVDPQTNNFDKGERAVDLIEQAQLRPQSQIDEQRDWAELWHWRCRTHTLLKEKKIPNALPNGTPMAEIIRLTAEKAAGDGIFGQMIGDDFPAFGKPYRDVTDEEIIQLTSIAQERHKALNWLCGYAEENLWSATPTDT